MWQVAHCVVTALGFNWLRCKPNANPEDSCLSRITFPIFPIGSSAEGWRAENFTVNASTSGLNRDDAQPQRHLWYINDWTSFSLRGWRTFGGRPLPCSPSKHACYTLYVMWQDSNITLARLSESGKFPSCGSISPLCSIFENALFHGLEHVLDCIHILILLLKYDQRDSHSICLSCSSL